MANKPTNTRKERQRADRNFLILTIIVLIGLGGGLITWIFGGWALITALPFLLAGSILIAILWGFFLILEKLRDK
ncbi:MAG: hypothetical protein QNJ45_04725 [Ardenticatenaceae bacterium]|nr:hypothetical protein [Ardenticatenaceae bacterium]